MEGPSLDELFEMDFDFSHLIGSNGHESSLETAYIYMGIYISGSAGRW